MKKQIQRIKFRNKCKKIAVFSTSEIQKFDRNTNYQTMISTGLLEKALEQGYTVYVITTRSKFRDEIDSWWFNKVARVYTGYNGEGSNDSGFIETWKCFYQDREIDLNLLSLHYRQYHGEQYQSWTDYQENLSRFGIKRGKDFIPKNEHPFDRLM